MRDIKQWFSNLNSKTLVYFDILVSHNQLFFFKGQNRRKTAENVTYAKGKYSFMTLICMCMCVFVFMYWAMT